MDFKQLAFAWSSFGAKSAFGHCFILLAVLTIIVFFKHTNKKIRLGGASSISSFGLLGVGFIFLLVALLAWLIYLILGFFGITLPFNILRPLILALVAVLTLISIYQAREPKIKSYEVKINKLPDSWVDKKIVHLSDLHLGPVWRKNS